LNAAVAARPKERTTVPTYILFSTLTPEGRQTLHANPDRVLGVNKEVEDFGCKVLAQYATLGQFDFLTIVEADDSETVAHLSVDLGSRGTVTVSSLEALSVEALRSKLKGQKQLAAAPVVGATRVAGSTKRRAAVKRSAPVKRRG
jgi:uncharacterized protein with GYD domain